jgi:hypothetical protein
MNEHEVKNCPKCGKPMAKGRLRSYSNVWSQAQIYWAEEGKNPWKSREMVNVSEEARAYLCKDCWITVLYETERKGDEGTREPETDFARLLREERRRKVSSNE